MIIYLLKMNYVHLFFAIARTYLFYFFNAKHLDIIQIVQSLFARCRAKKDIIRVEHCHLALQHYRGGRPVPRAASLYDGGIQIYANIFVYVQVLPAHFAFLSFSNNQIAGLTSDLHPLG
jgi:hypothetical protein